MASRMMLTGVNIANCDGITKAGISEFSRSTRLEFIQFSADRLTQVEVIDLIVTMRKGIWCHVVDRAGRLDQETLRAKAAERGSRVLVRSTGALQDMRLRQ